MEAKHDETAAATPMSKQRRPRPVGRPRNEEKPIGIRKTGKKLMPDTLLINSTKMSELTGLSKSMCNRIIKTCNDEQEARGLRTVRGWVSYTYFYSRYIDDGTGVSAKAKGRGK